jgi:hypothetical protein
VATQAKPELGTAHFTHFTTATMLRQLSVRAANQVFRPATYNATRGYAAVSEEQWAAVSNNLQSDEAKAELAALKSTMNDLLTKAAPKEVEPIDWAAFKESTGTPELVGMYEKAFNGLTFPKYNGNDISEAKAMFAKLNADADALVADAEEKLKWVVAERKAVAAAKAKLSSAYIDDILEEKPELKATIHKSIKNREWF